MGELGGGLECLGPGEAAGGDEVVLHGEPGGWGDAGGCGTGEEAAGRGEDAAPSVYLWSGGGGYEAVDRGGGGGGGSGERLDEEAASAPEHGGAGGEGREGAGGSRGSVSLTLADRHIQLGWAFRLREMGLHSFL